MNLCVFHQVEKKKKERKNNVFMNSQKTQTQEFTKQPEVKKCEKVSQKVYVHLLYSREASVH